MGDELKHILGVLAIVSLSMFFAFSLFCDCWQKDYSNELNIAEKKLDSIQKEYQELSDSFRIKRDTLVLRRDSLIIKYRTIEKEFEEFVKYDDRDGLLELLNLLTE